MGHEMSCACWTQRKHSATRAIDAVPHTAAESPEKSFTIKRVEWENERKQERKRLSFTAASSEQQDAVARVRGVQSTRVAGSMGRRESSGESTGSTGSARASGPSAASSSPGDRRRISVTYYEVRAPVP